MKLVWLNIPKKDTAKYNQILFESQLFQIPKLLLYRMHSNHSVPHPALAGPGARVQMNKNDLSRAARRQKVLVSKLKPTLIKN